MQHRVREWQEEAKRLHDQKFQESAEVEAVHNEAIQITFEKTEALQKLEKTVGLTCDCRGGLLSDALRASGGDTARPQRAPGTVVADPPHNEKRASWKDVSRSLVSSALPKRCASFMQRKCRSLMRRNFIGTSKTFPWSSSLASHGGRAGGVPDRRRARASRAELPLCT